MVHIHHTAYQLTKYQQLFCKLVTKEHYINDASNRKAKHSTQSIPAAETHRCVDTLAPVSLPFMPFVEYKVRAVFVGGKPRGGGRGLRGLLVECTDLTSLS
eukprot:1143064-Pelagomonas_calceolata.AAC.4